MKAIDMFISDLLSGIEIGTSNEECRRYGVNDNRDLARKASKIFGDLFSRRRQQIFKNGRKVSVAKYYIEKKHINEALEIINNGRGSRIKNE